MNEYVLSLIAGAALVFLGSGLLALVTKQSKSGTLIRLLGFILAMAGLIVAVVGPIMFGARFHVEH